MKADQQESRMSFFARLKNTLSINRHEDELHWWMFSMAPLGVAFAFFFVFILPLEIPEKDVVLVTGFAAGFAGLQTYWIFRGWRRSEGLTMLLGIVSIIAVAALVWWYIVFLGDFLQAHSSIPWIYSKE